MYCPNCGKADQKAETYCRQCGEFLPDLSGTNNLFRIQTPEEQFDITLVLNFLSALSGLIMAILLIVFHAGMENVHWSVYVSSSILFCISVWQGVSFYNNLMLKRRYNQQKDFTEVESKSKLNMLENTKRDVLPEADFEDVVPASVTEKTTSDLKEKLRRSTKS